MAVGFTPKNTQEILLDNLTPEQFLIVSLEAAKRLGWTIGTVTSEGFVAYTSFSMSSWSEEVKLQIENGYARITSACTGSQVVDWGKNKRNINHLADTIREIKETESADTLVQQYKNAAASVAHEEEQTTATETFYEPVQTTREKITDFFSIFKPVKGYFVTPLLIDINLVLFIAMCCTGANILLPDTDTLLKWGANFRPVTLEGEWWRLLTCCFLHIGVLHLLMNMYALLFIGILLEPRLGSTRFFVAYILTGIAASVTSLWWHDLTISAGASGAIFGMYGVFLALLSSNLIEKAQRQALLTSIGIFVAYNLINGMKGGIDNAAHIGGLVSGLVIGFAFLPGLKKPDAPALRNGAMVILTAVILAGTGFVYRNLPNDIGKYDARMKTFFNNETTALEVYNMSPETPTPQALKQIREQGINSWVQNIALLTELDKLNLPAAIHTRNSKLLNYCNFRLKAFNLMHKTVEENSEAYNDSIRYYNQQVEAAINSLKE